MFNLYDNNKKELVKRKNIKIFLVIILIIVSGIVVSFINDINNSEEYIYGIGGNYLVYKGLIVICILLSLISYISCVSYYMSIKKDEYFTISLVYLNLFISTSIERVDLYDGFTIINYILRTIILLFLITDKNKYIVRVKSLSIAIVIILTLLGSVWDSIILKSVYYTRAMYIVLIIMVVASICYLIVAMFLACKSMKEVDIVYSYVMGSISLLVIRGFCMIYKIVNIGQGESDYIYYKFIYITICSFILLVCGIFLEFTKKNNESISLEKELMIFYQIAEFNINDNIILYDSNGYICYANRQVRNKWCSTTELKEQYIELRDIWCKFGYDIKKLYRIIEKDKFVKRYIEIKNINRVFDLYAQVIITNNNEKYYVFRFNDITDEYRISTELKRNEQMLRNINDNIQEIIVGIDKDGYIAYLNNAAKTSLGNFEVNSGKINYYDLIDNEEERGLLKARMGEKISHKISKIDNKKLHFESIVTEVSYSDFTGLSRIIVSRDLEQKEKYKSLVLEYNTLKDYERMKNEFFVSLSHELKTPLNIIFSSVQLFDKMDNIDASQFKVIYDRYKEVIRINCLRMSRLINNIIDVLVMDSGNVKMNLLNINIVELIEAIVNYVNKYSNRKSISITFDTELEEINIKCDPEKITRIVVNILSNAIKFSGDKKNIYVNIKYRENELSVEIIDEGIGISNNMKEKIFKPFTQVDKSLTRENEGSGIGLSIAKILTSLHGGTIKVESTLGKGSKFSVVIPNENFNDSINKRYDIYEIDTRNIDMELSDIYELY